MKKVFLFAALTGLFLASCSNDEFFGSTENKSTTNEIGFGMNVPNLTRATTGGAAAAQKLNNNFVVYGFKCEDAEQPDGTKQQTVFGRYNVNYIGNSGTTQSNTKGWEYVGYTSLDSELQTMKYWDYSAESYVFSAIAGVGVDPAKVDSGATVYDKGWKVTIPAGGSLSSLYASARVPVTKTVGSDNVYKYPETVDMTFYSMGTKVRFGIYETVPGYEVHINKFYCKNASGKFEAASNTESNFGINGTFLTPNVDKATELTVTYYDNTTAVVNRPKITFDPASVAPANPNSAKFGTNMQATTAIGETSVTATYDKTDGEYTFILPYQDSTNVLNLYVDFTLKAPNGETISVKQAKATVPAAYTQWKENFAYTYLFKISDNTNGTTGTPKDPDDPTKPWEPGDTLDPQGLYSITFDACIVNAEAGLTQEGVQEVIASTTTPSITTYAKGTVVTKNNEYTAGEVYYSAMNDSAFISTANSAVYEVIYSGKAAITEKLVADYAKGNGVILVPVATTEATEVPLSDGTKLTFKANECKYFTAAAGKNYAIVYTIGGKETFKVVRVAGTNTTTPDYKVNVPASTTIKATESVAFTLTNGTATSNILGAATFFKVFNGADDVTKDFTVVANGTTGYIITPTAAAVAAGANGVYTIKYGTAEADNDFTVSSTYAISYTTGTTATVVKLGTTDTVTLKVDGTAYPKAKIANKPKGITVTDNADGTYTIAAGDSATIGADSLTIAGQTVKVKVVSYSLVAGTEVSKTIVWPETKATAADLGAEFDIQLKLDGAVCAKEVDIVSSNTAVTLGGTSSDTGTFEVKPTATCPGGTAELTYENAKFTYTVNRYFLNSSVATIKKATESTNLTFWLNGKQLNAATKTVVVKKGGTVITTGFSLTSNGRDLTFGNVAEAGSYRIEYYDETKTTVLGYEVITVN